MTHKPLVLVVLLFTVAVAASAEWEFIAPGVAYQAFLEPGREIHVARVDLTSDAIRVIASDEADRQTRVSQFAQANKAVLAINGDYFDKEFKPTGLAVGPCGPWVGTKDTEREPLLAVGDNRAEIYPPKEVMEEPEGWVEAVVSGWPRLISGCKALSSADLPGSDHFTRAPHPRTAVGLSKNKTRLYLVVVDGRRESVPGMTLAELASWMRKRLRVCSAINLDGGGSSAMWVRDRIVNKPSDGTERRVANHLGVVAARDYAGCLAPEGETHPAATTKTLPVPSGIRR